MTPLERKNAGSMVGFVLVVCCCATLAMFALFVAGFGLLTILFVPIAAWAGIVVVAIREAANATEFTVETVRTEKGHP